MASFSNHNTPREQHHRHQSTSSINDDVDDGTFKSATTTIGDTLWSQIVIHLEVPERDEIKRILGNESIDGNESLQGELSALKSILDDYRARLSEEAEEEAEEVEEAEEESVEKKEARRRRRRREDGKSKQTTMSTGSAAVVGESMLRPHHSTMQQQFLENQIRSFVLNLSSLTSSTVVVPSLKTPRERHLVETIVGSGGGGSGSGTSGHTSSRGSRGSSRRTTPSPNKTKRRERSKTSPTTTTPERPGTAPEENRTEEEMLRPSSRGSDVSSASAPDVLLGLTPYLNIHQVETVL